MPGALAAGQVADGARRILLFPQGNANGQPNDMVSVYLDYANPKTAPEGWHACAQFCLAISNPADPTVNTSSRMSYFQYPP
jgi:ubiquitin carboxyl-terminal hydrolase 7